MQVHEEYFIVCKVLTALPVGQRSAAGVAFERLPHLDAINRYLIANAANRLIRNGTNAFEQRHATREMTSIGQKCRERLRWNDDHEIVHHQLARRLYSIQSDRCTLRGIPDQPRIESPPRCGDENGCRARD